MLHSKMNVSNLTFLNHQPQKKTNQRCLICAALLYWKRKLHRVIFACQATSPVTFYNRDHSEYNELYSSRENMTEKMVIKPAMAFNTLTKQKKQDCSFKNVPLNGTRISSIVVLWASGNTFTYKHLTQYRFVRQATPQTKYTIYSLCIFFQVVRYNKRAVFCADAGPVWIEVAFLSPVQSLSIRMCPIQKEEKGQQ